MTNLPVNGDFTVTAAFGEVGSYWKNGHMGIDIVANDKTVYCTCEGTVRVIDYDENGWGRYVSVGDSNGNRHIFCHLEKDSVKVVTGQYVTRKTVIGTMGKTGNVTGVHLHYQINNNAGIPINPTEHLRIPNKRGSYNSKNFSVYADESEIADYAKDAVKFVTDREIMLGDGTNFNPTDFITRQEIAVILKRILEE